jgi:hypothetical protein
LISVTDRETRIEEGKILRDLSCSPDAEQICSNCETIAILQILSPFVDEIRRIYLPIGFT